MNSQKTPDSCLIVYSAPARRRIQRVSLEDLKAPGISLEPVMLISPGPLGHSRPLQEK
jgi:hypothetical protein